MPKTQRRYIEGTAILGTNRAYRAISIPRLPHEGTWTVTGTIIQAPVGLAANAVTWNVQWGGRCHAGTSTNDATNAVASNPSAPIGYAPAPPVLVNVGGGGGGVDPHCLEIEVSTARVATYVSWSLDCIVTAAHSSSPSA